MERREFVASSVVGSVGLWANGLPAEASAEIVAPAPAAAVRKILIAGGNFNTAFIRYMATLTGKKRPRLLYLPTASADAPDGTIAWFQACAPLDVQPFVQNSFIESLTQKQSWSEVLLSMDGIVASGGNTPTIVAVPRTARLSIA